MPRSAPACRLMRALLAALLLPATLTAEAQAQTPAQPLIKLVVPYPAGGITDQVARLLVEKMAQQLGQVVIIDNRPGAAGRIGIDAVVKAPADGTTLLLTNSSYSILPVIEAKAGYDPLKSMVPLGMVATYGLGIVTSLQTPVTTLQQFIDHARKNPGKLSYGSSGPGSGSHFAGEYFKALTGTYLVHIPYRSTSAALNDVAGGILDLSFDASIKPLVDAGKVRLLAVTSEQRDPRFPNVPTATEAGLKGYVQMSWVGLLASAGTPAATVERLNQAAARAAADPAVHKGLLDMGLQPASVGRHEHAQMIRQELALYARIAADAKLKFD